MSLYVALARHPLVAVISNHLDTVYKSSRGNCNCNFFWSVAGVVAPTQTQTLLQSANQWVNEHPIVTGVLVASVVLVGALTITYFVAPHLLGITVAGAAGAVDPLKEATKQLAEERKLRTLAEATARETSTRLIEVSSDLASEKALNVSSSETIRGLTFQVAEERSLRTLSETTTRETSTRLLEVSSDLASEKGLRTAAEARLSEVSGELDSERVVRFDAEARLSEISGDLDSERLVRLGAQAQINHVNAFTDSAIDAMSGRLQQATTALDSETKFRININQIKVLDEVRDGEMLGLLSKIRMEPPKPIVLNRTGPRSYSIPMSEDRKDLIGHHLLDAFQATHNIILDKPIQEPLPLGVGEKLVPFADVFLNEVVRAIFT